MARVTAASTHSCSATSAFSSALTAPGQVLRAGHPRRRGGDVAEPHRQGVVESRHVIILTHA
ncbi:hypothetical protein [Nonomuraea typhae]|uniref:hypothetical protein n=1 Tax=Nonomuraea typhae TaxID=2603600 RepID=UPI0012FB3584|nr:hypothetical protein [Nonomuraea typhae]